MFAFLRTPQGQKFATIVAAVTLSALYSQFMLKIDGWFGINAAATLFISGKLIGLNMIPIGHGVKQAHVLGLPFFHLVAYGVLALFLAVFTTYVPKDGVPIETALRLQAIAAAALIGWLAGLFNWYFQAYDETYYVSEASERKDMKARGFTQEEIDNTINDGRARGIFRPR